MFKKLRCTIVAAWLGASAAMAGTRLPQYIFYFIGDGMGWGQVALTQNWLRSVDADQTPLLMTTFPYVTACTTHAANGPVTDSAAAGTALATGSKTNKGMIGMNADTLPVTSIATKLKAQGYGVALVTTVAQDDATPAAFYAHVPDRNMFGEIGLQAAASGFDFIAGASLRGRLDGTPAKARIDSALTANKWSLVNGLDNIAKAPTDRIMLIAPDAPEPNSVGYAIDADTNATTIEGMTAAALRHLLRVSPQSFFMMVEGGNIDHASHANDAGAVAYDVKAFNNALRQAYDFYLAHPDQTLIVVTADHNTGGLTVGNDGTGSNAFIEKARGQRISKEGMTHKIKQMLHSGSEYTWQQTYEMLGHDLGLGTVVKLKDKDVAKLKEAWHTTFVQRDGKDVETLYSSFDPLTTVAFKVLDKYSGAGWTSAKHTGNPVPVMAIGVGAEQFRGLLDNTQLPGIIERLIIKK